MFAFVFCHILCSQKIGTAIKDFVRNLQCATRQSCVATTEQCATRQPTITILPFFTANTHHSSLLHSQHTPSFPPLQPSHTILPSTFLHFSPSHFYLYIAPRDAGHLFVSLSLHPVRPVLLGICKGADTHREGSLLSVHSSLLSIHSSLLSVHASLLSAHSSLHYWPVYCSIVHRSIMCCSVVHGTHGQRSTHNTRQSFAPCRHPYDST